MITRQIAQKCSHVRESTSDRRPRQPFSRINSPTAQKPMTNFMKLIFSFIDSNWNYNILCEPHQRPEGENTPRGVVKNRSSTVLSALLMLCWSCCLTSREILFVLGGIGGTENTSPGEWALFGPRWLSRFRSIKPEVYFAHSHRTHCSSFFLASKRDELLLLANLIYVRSKLNNKNIFSAFFSEPRESS